MNRTRMLAAAFVAAFGTAAFAAGAATSKLVASVSDPLHISLTRGGAKFTHLKPGTYTIVVHDLASDHNFRLSGPGVNKATSIGGKGTSTWTALKKGAYTYVCDPHKAIMKGGFTVS